MREIRKLPRGKRAADRRRHRQGDEGRPREVHRGRRLGLPVQAGRHRCSCSRCSAWLAVPLNARPIRRPRRRTTASAPDILIVDDLPEKLLVFRTVLEELGQSMVCARSGAQALKEMLDSEFAVDPARRQHARHGRLRDRRADPPATSDRAHADHLHHRLRRRDADRRGYSLGAVDYILSPVSAGRPAHQGEGLRRPPPDAAASAPARQRAGGARRGRGGAPGRRGEHAPLAFLLARQPRARARRSTPR